MRPYTLSRIRGCASVRLGPKASAPFRLAAHAAFCGFALRKGWPLGRSCSFLRLRLTKRETGAAFWNSCLNEKFLALWRGSLPADLVYELQFSFNFQLPVFKDQDDPERGRSRKQQTFALRILMHLLLAGVSPSLPEGRCLLRKEVIQPLVPQRLPCYDFIPITTHTLGRQMPDFGCRRLS